MGRLSPAGAVIEFGRFRLVPQRRMLSSEGRLVDLGGRAIDVLMALVGQAGEVLDHDKLRRLAWPGQIVEENNLQVQISALRKALGADRDLIRTVVGRGYQFTGAVSMDLACEELPAPHNLPVPMSELIGREVPLREAAALLMSGRLTTLAGAGGIGKSRLALALARHLLPEFADGVRWIDLSGVSGPDCLAKTVAAALGSAAGNGASDLAAMLARKRVLLVLDGCEHLVAAATALVEALLRACAGVRLLVTSREPLRSDGEAVYRLQPLQLSRTADCAAVQLFLARARGADPHFAPGPVELSAIATICCRLDGMPLAIELAAAHAPVLGLELLSARLDDPLQLLVGGHRTALAHQRSLRASLDWSHALLGQRERMALRRLAIFAAPFTLEAAIALLGRHGMSIGELVDCIASLVAKSLLIVDGAAAIRRYRLAWTTRAYGLAKLRERGEHPALARRHAQYYAGLFAAPGQIALWPAEDAMLASEVGAALDWAFGCRGDVALGMALAAGAAPLWWRLSMPDEALRQTRRALAAAGAGTDPACLMQLQAALATALSFAPAVARAEAEPIWREVQCLAEARGDVPHRLRALAGLWAARLDQGDLAGALFLAEAFGALARENARTADAAHGERLCAHVLHVMGRQDAARLRFERMLARLPAQAGPGFCQALETRVAAQADLSMVLWLQGCPGQALRLAGATIDQARAGGHAAGLCHALAVSACPIALLTGELEALDDYAQLLLDTAAAHGLEGASAVGCFYRGLLAERRGGDVSGLPAALAQLRIHGDAMLYTLALVWFAHAMANAGEVGEAGTAIDRALMRAAACGECWGSAEMLRLKGELLLRQGVPDTVVDGHFCDALATARRQGAPAIELRCASSLARLWRGRPGSDGRLAAGAMLAEACARFGESAAYPDLREARSLLLSLG